MGINDILKKDNPTIEHALPLYHRHYLHILEDIIV